jgi:hypothetical protein
MAPGENSVDRLVLINPDSGETRVIAAPGMTSWDQQRLAP